MAVLPLLFGSCDYGHHVFLLLYFDAGLRAFSFFYYIVGYIKYDSRLLFGRRA